MHLSTYRAIESRQDYFGTDGSRIPLRCIWATLAVHHCTLNALFMLGFDCLTCSAPEQRATLRSNDYQQTIRVKLPIALEREPLIDAVFEVRLAGDPHVADILPGALYREYTNKPAIQRLPAAEIPQPVRASDPALAYAPTIRLDLGDFVVSLGDRNVVVGCKLPYPKWPRFKEEILKVVRIISEVGIAGQVVRYSLKYINLIESESIEKQIAKIKVALRIGDIEAKSDHLSIQLNVHENKTLHMLSVVTSASAVIKGRRAYGVIVDVDSVRAVDFPDFASFENILEPELEELRQENKLKFFGCLRQETIDEMGPIYD